MISGESVSLSGPWVLHWSSVPLSPSPSFTVLGVGWGVSRTLIVSLHMILSEASVLLWDNPEMLRRCGPEAPALHTSPQGPGAGTFCLEHIGIKGPLKSVAQWPQHTSEQTETREVRTHSSVKGKAKVGTHSGFMASQDAQNPSTTAWCSQGC